jgi:hypothetical protein
MSRSDIRDSMVALRPQSLRSPTLAAGKSMRHARLGGLALRNRPLMTAKTAG